MRWILVILLLISVAGCSKAPPTTRVNYWVEAVRAPDAKLRKKAAFTLGNLGTTDPVAVLALRGALMDADAAVRCEAILALLKCGPAAAEAIPTLTEMRQRDPNPQVRRYAAKAIEKLANESIVFRAAHAAQRSKRLPSAAHNPSTSFIV